MKLKILSAGVVACLLLAVSSIVSAAPITNGGFEQGLAGWTATSSSANGSVDVVSSCTNTGTPACLGAFAPYQPMDGTHFALLWSRVQLLAVVVSNSLPDPVIDTMTLVSQGVPVAAGSIVRGRVFFSDGQLFNQPVLRANGVALPDFCDTASVRILLNAAPVTLFTANSCTTTGDDSTPWTSFVYQAPRAGVLSVEATLSNTTFSVFNVAAQQATGSISLPRGSALGLDALQIVDPVVAPQPQTGYAPLGGHGTRDNLARQAAIDAAAQQAAQQAVVAASAASAASQPATGALRPPNTGDAGLLDQDRRRHTDMVGLAAILSLTVIGAGLVRFRTVYAKH